MRITDEALHQPMLPQEQVHVWLRLFFAMSVPVLFLLAAIALTR